MESPSLSKTAPTALRTARAAAISSAAKRTRTSYSSLFEWDSLEQAHEFSLSPGLREKMQQAGDNGRPEIFYLEKVEDLEK